MNDTSRTRPARGWRLWLALAVVYLVWGSTYLAIRVMVETIPPLLGAGVRFLLAGAVLYPVLLVRRGWAAVRVPARQAAAAAAVGLLFLAGGTGLVTVAERDVPSGLAAVLVASMPLAVVLLCRLVGEPVPRATALGVTAGFAGVAVLLLPGNPTPEAGGFGLALILVATASMAVGSFLSGRLPVPGDTLVATALELLAAGVVLGGAGLLRGPSGPRDRSVMDRGRNGDRQHAGSLPAAPRLPPVDAPQPTGGEGDAGWGVRVGAAGGGPMQLKELTVWWQQRRLGRERRIAFDSVATRELYEALDEASMLAPRR